ncbi:CGNR zinc finger domain-containing protein [Mesorhizobium sp. 43Arga]
MTRVGSLPSKGSGAMRAAESKLASEDLAMRFVNTAAWRLRTDVEERLPSPIALLDWFQANGLLSRGRKAEFQRDWKTDVDTARSVYKNAIALREVIYNLLVARIDGQTPRSRDIEAFNKFLLPNGASAAIAWQAGEYGWRAPASAAAVASSFLMPIAMSAAELMTGVRSKKVRQCQDDRGCGWLFVDESRAQNRRWCSMGDCGNRAKAHRHYERAKRKF